MPGGQFVREASRQGHGSLCHMVLEDSSAETGPQNVSLWGSEQKAEPPLGQNRLQLSCPVGLFGRDSGAGDRAAAGREGTLHGVIDSRAGQGCEVRALGTSAVYRVPEVWAAKGAVSRTVESRSLAPLGRPVPCVLGCLCF